MNVYRLLTERSSLTKHYLSWSFGLLARWEGQGMSDTTRDAAE